MQVAWASAGEPKDMTWDCLRDRARPDREYKHAKPQKGRWQRVLEPVMNTEHSLKDVT